VVRIGPQMSLTIVRRVNSMARRKTWKKGKVFRKGRRKVRYIYPNGKKKGRKLVSASKRR